MEKRTVLKNILQDAMSESKHWVADRHHNHDIWLHWSVNERCNLNCIYCDSHGNPLKKRGRNSEIDIPALIRNLDGSGKTYKIRFTGGGEPFLVPGIIEACIEITKKHYVGFNTNLTCGNIREFAQKIDPERVVNVNASLHIEELERLNLIKRVIDNFLFCKERGISIVASVVAYPALLHNVEKYKSLFERKGIKINFSYFMGIYDNKEYPRSYTEEEIVRFDLNRDWLNKHYSYRGLCNAGYNAAMVDHDGNIFPCEGRRKTIGNIYRGFKFNESLMACPVNHCTCPLKQFDPYLFKRALRENSSIVKKTVPMIKCAKSYVKAEFAKRRFWL